MLLQKRRTPEAPCVEARRQRRTHPPNRTHARRPHLAHHLAALDARWAARGGMACRRPLIDEVTAWTKTVMGMQLVDSGDHVCELFCHRGAEVRHQRPIQLGFRRAGLPLSTPCSVVSAAHRPSVP